MPMPDISTIDRISASMSISSLRNQVIASNIANHDTPGYRRLALSFRQALDGAAAATVAPEAPDTSAGASMEQDIVELSTNATHYQALARVLTRWFAIANTITSSK